MQTTIKNLCGIANASAAFLDEVAEMLFKHEGSAEVIENSKKRWVNLRSVPSNMFETTVSRDSANTIIDTHAPDLDGLARYIISERLRELIAETMP